jgi:hypothetical protein
VLSLNLLNYISEESDMVSPISAPKISLPPTLSLPGGATGIGANLPSKIAMPLPGQPGSTPLPPMKEPKLNLPPMPAPKPPVTPPALPTLAPAKPPTISLPASNQPVPLPALKPMPPDLKVGVPTRTPSASLPVRFGDLEPLPAPGFLQRGGPSRMPTFPDSSKPLPGLENYKPLPLPIDFKSGGGAIPIPNATRGGGRIVPIPNAQPGQGSAIPIPNALRNAPSFTLASARGSSIPALSVPPQVKPVLLAGKPASNVGVVNSGAAQLLRGGPLVIQAGKGGSQPIMRAGGSLGLTDAQKDAATLPGRAAQAQLDFANGKITQTDLLNLAKDSVLKDPKVVEAATKLFNNLSPTGKALVGGAQFVLSPGQYQRVTGNAAQGRPELGVVSNGLKLPDARVTLPIAAPAQGIRPGGVILQAGGSGNVSINGAIPLSRKADVQLTPGVAFGKGMQQYTLGVDKVVPGAKPGDLTRVTGFGVSHERANGAAATGLTYSNKITDGVEGGVNAGTVIKLNQSAQNGLGVNYEVTGKSGNGWNVGVFGGGAPGSLQQGFGVQGGFNFRF